MASPTGKRCTSGWHCRLDSVFSLRRTLLVRFTQNGCAMSVPCARQRASAILNYKGTEGDSLPKRQCHGVALSSRQCFLPASYLARSIYAERLCDERPLCVAWDLGDPELQGNGRRFTAETAVPRGGTVVSTVFSPCVAPCSFDLRRTLVRRGMGVRGKGASAILNYKGTEGDSLPRRQCHGVALSSRQCFLPASYLARSIYAERLCDERPLCVATCLGDPELQGNGRRFTAETAVPRGGTVVSTVFSPCVAPCSFDLRRTLLCDEGWVCVERCLGDPELQGNGRRFTAETAVPRGGTGENKDNGVGELCYLCLLCDLHLG